MHLHINHVNCELPVSPLCLLSFFSHGSDSVEAAENEIALWFTESELNAWAPASNPWIYE